jgi:single-strand DNA-binding protein
VSSGGIRKQMANRVYLEGNVTRDTTVVATNGMPMAFLHLAAEREWEGSNGQRKRQTLFSSVVCFGPLAEYAVQMGTRGRPVRVEGSLRTRERDAGDGRKRQELEVVAETVQILESRTPSVDQPRAGVERGTTGERAL